MYLDCSKATTFTHFYCACSRKIEKFSTLPENIESLISYERVAAFKQKEDELSNEKEKEFNKFSEKNDWIEAMEEVVELHKELLTVRRVVKIKNSHDYKVKGLELDCNEFSSVVMLNCCFAPLLWGFGDPPSENADASVYDQDPFLMIHAGPRLSGKMRKSIDLSLLKDKGLYKAILDIKYNSSTDMSITSVPYVTTDEKESDINGNEIGNWPIEFIFNHFGKF